MSFITKIFSLPEPERDGAVCMLFTGLPGGGKSLIETLDYAIDHLLAGEDVKACYWLNWAGSNFHYFPPTEDGFNSIKDSRNSVIIFDELAQIWDPRRYNNESPEVRAFFQLHRHRHNDIYGNTQDISLIAKTVGIVGSNFIQVEKMEDGWLNQLIRKWLKKPPRIGIIKRHMSLKEMKKETYGFDLEYQIEERGDIQEVWYEMSDIIREDLNEFKVETIHRYCNRCKSRQGEQIKKEDNEKVAEYDGKLKIWKLKEKEYCPKHHEEELEIRLSGMYDTDYEPETKQEKYKTKEFKTCDCGFDHLVK